MRSEGIFITFEGGEGTGKTTVVNYLLQKFTHAGYQVTLQREPGGTVISERIRDLVKDMQLREMNARTEALLMAAARAQLVEECYMPALANGELVFADRYVDSTYAYQGYGRGLSLSLLDKINELATRRLMPDKTFLFDADPEVGHRRRIADGRVDRIELEDMEFFRRVRQGYLRIAEQAPERVVAINAARTLKEVGEEVARQIEKVLREKHYEKE
jgi:dTMP kinase